MEAATKVSPRARVLIADDHRLFAEALEAILAEAEEDPEIAKGAPYTTPVRRLDEAAAARRPVVRQR